MTRKISNRVALDDSDEENDDFDRGYTHDRASTLPTSGSETGSTQGPERVAHSEIPRRGGGFVPLNVAFRQASQPVATNDSIPIIDLTGEQTQPKGRDDGVTKSSSLRLWLEHGEAPQIRQARQWLEDEEHKDSEIAARAAEDAAVRKVLLDLRTQSEHVHRSPPSENLMLADGARSNLPEETKTQRGNDTVLMVKPTEGSDQRATTPTERSDHCASKKSDQRTTKKPPRPRRSLALRVLPGDLLDDGPKQSCKDENEARPLCERTNLGRDENCKTDNFRPDKPSHRQPHENKTSRPDENTISWPDVTLRPRRSLAHQSLPRGDSTEATSSGALHENKNTHAKSDPVLSTVLLNLSDHLAFHKDPTNKHHSFVPRSLSDGDFTDDDSHCTDRDDTHVDKKRVVSSSENHRQDKKLKVPRETTLTLKVPRETTLTSSSGAQEAGAKRPRRVINVVRNIYYNPRPDLVPAQWPYDVAHLNDHFNPLGIGFEFILHYEKSHCSSPCRFHTCFNGKNGLFCVPNACSFIAKCGNRLKTWKTLQLMRKRQKNEKRKGVKSDEVEYAVTTSRAIPAGVIIGEYLGRLSFEPVVRSERSSNEGYRLYMHRDRGQWGNYTVCINANSHGNILRFCNHSCDANANFHQVANGQTHTVVVVTNQIIEPGEEITVDVR